MLPALPFGNTGHESSRVLFGAAALWRCSQDEADRYLADYKTLSNRELCTAKTVPLAELQEMAERYRARLNGAVSPLRLRVRMARMNAAYQRQAHPGLLGHLRAALALAFLAPRPGRVWIADLGHAALFDLRRGLTAVSLPREQCDVSLASDSLGYAFRFLWGGSSLQINGRFHELHPEGRLPLFDALWMADGMNRQAEAEARPL